MSDATHDRYESRSNSESNQSMSARAVLRRMFEIDLRSFALFRVGLASLLLVDLFLRWRNIKMLYTDHGVLPQQGLLEIYGASIKWSTLHYYTDANWATQSVMFLVAAVFATFLFFGYRTWLATLCCWIFLVSLNRRLPNSATGADTVVRAMLFWSLWLPLGARWSVDSALNSAKDIVVNRFYSFANLAVLLQVCYIYWFTAALKLHPDWLNGEAVGHAVRLDFYALPLATWLADKHAITKFLTYATLAAEALLPVVALSPILNVGARWFAILSMWGFHIGTALCMDIGSFPYICMVCWLLFIPTETWDALCRKLGTPNRINSVIASVGLSRVMVVVSATLSMRPNRIQPTRGGAVLCVVFFAFITAYNILGMDQLRRFGGMPSQMQLAAKVLRADQRWGMFAPTPNVMDGWFAMPARLADGPTVDLWLKTDSATFDKPRRSTHDYPDNLVKKYMMAFRDNPGSDTWLWFARYVVREWNATHPPSKAVTRMQIVFVREIAHDQGTSPTVLVDYDPKATVLKN